MTMIMQYQPTIEEEELRKIIEDDRRYVDSLDPNSRESKIKRSRIVKLERVLRCLEMRSDYFMTAMAEDIVQQIVKVRQHPMAGMFVGMLLYYELKPRYEWRDDGLNPMACTGNIDGWCNEILPLGKEQCDFLMEDPYNHDWRWNPLKGTFVPIGVNTK